MKKHILILVPVTSLLLMGCRYDFWNKASHGEPSGQVVATVGSTEVTLRDLRSELPGNIPNKPEIRKAAEDATLTAIVRRVALANAARASGVDKEPEYAIAKQRADDLVLIEVMQHKVARSVPPPSRDEVDLYVSEHRDVFAARKIIRVDQIRTFAPNRTALLEDLKPFHSLDEVAAYLTQKNVRFLRGGSTYDAVGQDPAFIDAVLKIPPQEVFMFVDNAGVVIGQVRAIETVPFTGEPAQKYATMVLKQRREQEAVTRSMNEILAKAAGEVKYNKGYAPKQVKLGVPAK